MWWEIPGHLESRNHELYIGGLSAEDLARKYKVEEGPVAVYSMDRIRDNHTRISTTLKDHLDIPVHVYVAVKANSSLPILKHLDKTQYDHLWADVVSPNEGKLCLEAGIPSSQIKYTGTSVSNHDLDRATDMDIMINCDSFSQIRRMGQKGYERDVSIRWNPGKGAGETEHTITAGPYVKFGIPEDRICDAFGLALYWGLEPGMLHQHIGSNWKGEDVGTFLETVDHTMETARKILETTGRSGFREISLGGGPGIRYHQDESDFDVEAYAEGIGNKFRDSDLTETVGVEPGRYIFGDSGILLSEINTVEKKGTFLIGDNSGFNHLMRPQMYGSHHELVVCNKADAEPYDEWMVAGNLCESGDVRTGDKHKLRALPEPHEGDILAALNYGAYGFSMASEYNSRSLPAEVLIVDGKDYLIRERGTFQDLLRNQLRP